MGIATTAACRQGFEAWQLGAELALLSAEAVAQGAKAVANEIARRRNYRPPRCTLLPCPDAAAVLEGWHALKQDRSPGNALRVGAMLLNISQYVDCSPIYGRGEHIVARNPGVKGWLKTHCPTIAYATAMSYRKLAELTCAAIRLHESIPLEWVLPGSAALDTSRELIPEIRALPKASRRDLLRQGATCRQTLEGLLDGVRNVNQLLAKLDALTQGHRHRSRAKGAAASPSDDARQRAERSLRSALLAVRSAAAQDLTQPQKDALLALVADIRRTLAPPGG